MIPNCSINGVTNWNESKEVPAELGCNDIGLRNFSERCRLSVRVIASPNYCGPLARAWVELHSPPENGAAQQCGWQNLGPDTAAVFIEHSSEI